MEFELRYNVDGAVCSVGRCVLDEINVFTVSSLVYTYTVLVISWAAFNGY